MKYVIQLTKQATKDLARLDKAVAQRIVHKLKTYQTNKDPLAQAKALSGIFEGLYRFRIGNYRAIFEIDRQGRINILLILTIKHRKDLY